MLSFLNQIEITDSTNAKLALLKANSHNELLKRIYYMTYSRRLQYGIKKIPMYTPNTNDLTIEDALDFLEFKLAKRSITGNAAIQEFGKILSSMSLDDAEVIRRVISRDLECGASRTMANKVWKNLVPEQPQMLANPYSNKTISNIIFPAYAQLKADGSRCFAEIRGTRLEDVVLVSRAGNEHSKLNALKQELIDKVTPLLQKYPEGVYIDGELVCVKRKQKTGLDFLLGNTEENDIILRSESNGIANKSLHGTISEDEEDLISYQIWDIIPLNIVYSESKIKSETYENRFKELNNTFINCERIIIIENTIVNNLEEAQIVYQKYVDQGLEGIILKNINGIWENKRSKNQVKFKQIIDADLEIVGVYPHSKNANKLGGLELKSKCGKITVNAGTGLTDTDKKRNDNDEWENIPLQERHHLNRELLWSKKDELIGQIVECECNGWLTSKSRKDGTVGLFLPVIKTIRIDKAESQSFEEIFGLPFTITGI